MITLQNDHIKATFVNKGAELQSLKSKKTGINYLWKGDPAYWGKHSPILFPIVGGLKDNTYFYNGVAYNLPRHGFARDMKFEVNEINNTELLFTLQYNDETLRVYPFKFQLGLRYKLSESKLSCIYEVMNPGNEFSGDNRHAGKELLFSIGGHPAFTAPLLEDNQYNNCFVEFNKDNELTYHKIKDDLIDNETSVLKLAQNRLYLKHELFYNDALVLKTLKSNCISLRNNNTPHGLHFTFKDFPFFGIWAAKDADFVCLEPWCGIADSVSHNQNLTEKEGIISLPPGKLWQRKWEVEIF